MRMISFYIKMRKFAKISEFLEKNINSKRDHLVSFFIYEIYLLLYISYLKYNLMTIKRKTKGEKHEPINHT